MQIKETLFVRTKNKIKNLKTKETTVFDSINLAKKEVRNLISTNGLGSVRKR